LTLGVCNLGDETCVFQNRPDGTECNDGNPCTVEAACDEGACVQQTAVECPPAGPCFLEGTCDPGTGFCSTVRAPNGTPCSPIPGVECSAGGSCLFGSCRAQPGSEDPDEDLICSLDDNCPDVGNPEQGDVDLDEEGDSCDRVAGTVGVWGELRNPLAAGPFPSDEPLRIHVRDGVQLDFAFTFEASDCRSRSNGKILCRSDAFRGVRLDLLPEEDAAGSEVFRLKLRASGLDLPGPFQPPVVLAIVREPPAEVLGIDCYGEALNCRSTPRGMRCVVP
jgi:hypothetical protein